MKEEQFLQLMAKLDEIKAAINPPQCRAPGCLKNAVSDSEYHYCQHHENMSRQLEILNESLVDGDPNSDSWKRKADRCSAMEVELGV